MFLEKKALKFNLLKHFSLSTFSQCFGSGLPHQYHENKNHETQHSTSLHSKRFRGEESEKPGFQRFALCFTETLATQANIQQFWIERQLLTHPMLKRN